MFSRRTRRTYISHLTNGVRDNQWFDIGNARTKAQANKGDGKDWTLSDPPIRPGTHVKHSFESDVFFAPKTGDDGKLTRTLGTGAEKEFKTYTAKIIVIKGAYFFRLLKPTKHGANEWFKVVSQKLKDFIDDSKRTLPQENPRTLQEVKSAPTHTESHELSLHKHPTPWTRSGKPRR